MGCKSCQEPISEADEYGVFTSVKEPYPLKSRDIQVIDSEIRPFQESDWDNENHKLLIIVPAAFTPVCESELAQLDIWVDDFRRLDCDVYAVCQDASPMILDWFEQSGINHNEYLTFSSYRIPERLGLIRNGRSKRASCFLTKEGEVIIQQHFDNHPRDMESLYNQLKKYEEHRA